LAPHLIERLRTAGAVRNVGDRLRLAIRVSRLDGRLHLHSAPGRDAHAVFLGPDSYRFARLIAAILQDGAPVERALDIGVGPGAGALAVAARRPEAEVIGVDINPAATRMLSVNAAHAGLDVMAVEGRGLDAAPGLFDLIVANPPYVSGPSGRVYSDGGGEWGAELAMHWVRDGLPRLTDRGRFILYTGSPIVDGRDVVRERLADLLGATFDLAYEELDPDVFGGLLRREAYAEVERIAAVGAVITRRQPRGF
jgi:methylase of polypeptide subunit release factors